MQRPNEQQVNPDVALPGAEDARGLRFGPTPSGTGWQVSAWGVLGAALARAEGLELHFLGATIGIDPQDLAIKLPGLGVLGLRSGIRAAAGVPQS
jgi:hypothetical protein